MNDIICPHCKKAFKIDESGFTEILKQVRDHQFENEILQRLALAEKEKNTAIELAKAEIKNSLQEKISDKEIEINELKNRSAITLNEKLNAKESEINTLKSKLDNFEIEKKLAINEAVQKTEKERDNLANELKTKELEKTNLES